MAGNIVKWWKHKILGGYKQFSVLQECTTDSEELIYPVRAPSSCSAPPDLLMVNDHETIQMKQSVNLTTTKNQNHNKNHHHHGKSRGTTKSHPIENHHPSDNIENQRKNDNNDRIQLEEFTCDVSVEAGKSSQPLQFSFTFYDLDGHHGKITKDDIAGIVYTIYESIGKSVVVPHCGSKTINVRLTVSPEGKTKTSSSNRMKKLNSTINQTSSTAGVGIGVGVSGRRHRYRPRKLVKSDDDEDDIDSGSDKEITFINNKKGPTTSKYHHHHNQQQQQQQHRINPELAANVLDNNSQQHTPNKFPTGSENVYESVGNLKYYSKDPSRKVDIIECKECIQGSMVQPIGDNHHTQQQILKQSSTRAKLLRRARKQKYHEHYIESRQRSLSVGNETSWKLRAAARAAIVATRKTRPTDEIDGNLTQSPIITAGTSPTTTTTNECWNNALKRNDLIDIIRESMEKNRLCFQSNGKPQINGSPVHHRQRSNTTSKIIDEKYHQSRQQQQSPQTSHHIPIYHQQLAINPIILQKNQNNKTNLCGYDSYLHAKICTPTAATATTATTTAAQTTTTSCIPINNVQNQVPIQQTSSSKLITTTTTTINSPKIYVNSNNLITTTPTTRCNKLQRNIIVGNNSNGILLNGYHSQQNSPQFHGYQRLNSSQKQQQQHIKLKTTILNSLNPQLTAEEKLSRTIDHVEKWLNEREQEHQQTMMYKVNDLKLIKYAIRNNNNNSINDNKIDIIDNNSKCKKDEKNYDNLLYSKLNEKLQQKHIKTPTRKMTNNNTNNINNNINNNSNNNNNNNKENTRPHHHHQHHHRRRSNSSTSNSKLITLINVVDPLECENLLHQTSDDDITISPIITKTITTKTTTTKNSDNNDEINIIVEDDVNGSDHQNDANNCNNSNGNTSSTTTNSSMIQHRYVHEHIHHHYHHFENNE